MNVEIRTEATQFPEKEYVIGIFVAVQREYRLRERTAGHLYWRWGGGGGVG
jgi:hypothetical protein